MDTNITSLWVLNCYLNGARWDKHEQVYFASLEDAELAGKVMKEVVSPASAGTDYLRLDWGIYAVEPITSDVAERARAIASEWLADAGCNEE